MTLVRDILSERVGEIVAARPKVLEWYRAGCRPLPWRESREPYAIWVSEAMLQQTRVTTVIPYYRRFMDRFPDVEALAAAPEDDVLALWSGLGYYRRARLLQAGARAVMEIHDGHVPADAATLRELPGVGRYTAGAIASIAFDREEPVLDGNVRRVLGRLLAEVLDTHTASERDRVLWETAEEIVRGPSPGDLNQALMELGATVCTPRRPRCLDCPLGHACAARAGGDPEVYPPPRPRIPTVTVRVAVVVVRRAGRLLLERPGEASPLRGTWDLPAVELESTVDGTRRLATTLRNRHGLDLVTGPREARASHGIMNRRLRLEIHRGGLRSGRVAGRTALRWIAAGDIDRVPVSGATRKALRAIGEI